ncbi:hypothetical protein B0J14DRAFT_488341, partial [Halenospora varia]
YSNRGIPYRRGYLLYGPPRTGKSSLSLSIAGACDLDIYILNISRTTARWVSYSLNSPRIVSSFSKILMPWTQHNPYSAEPGSLVKMRQALPQRESRKVINHSMCRRLQHVL